jgi:hypothetical protein
MRTSGFALILPFPYHPCSPEQLTLSVPKLTYKQATLPAYLEVEVALVERAYVYYLFGWCGMRTSDFVPIFSKKKIYF